MIRKFRTHDESARDLRSETDVEKLIPRIRSLWSFSSRLTPNLMIPRGIRKFRTIEEAQLERDHWTQNRVDVLRRRSRIAR